ncbi:MAG: MFS transporter [candidate division WOR-3 bacterium]
MHEIDLDSETKKIALITTTLSSFLTPFMGSSINIALPAIGKELSLSAISLSWIATVYLLSAAVFLIPVGRIADIAGRKKIFLYGTGIYTLASFLLALSKSILTLILFRILQGIGSTMLFATSIAILSSVFPPEERGRVLGINVASVYSGLSLGPLLGGLLTQNLGWRSIFWINIPLGLLIFVLIITKLPNEWIESRNEKFDFLGSVIYGVTLVTFIFGLSHILKISGVTLIITSVICLIAFIFWELYYPSPLLNINLFRSNITFTFSSIAALINYSANSAVGFLLSLYLQYIKALTPQSAGLLLLAQPLTQAFFSPLTGRLSDRVEPRIIASIGMALGFMGLGLLTLIGFNTSITSIFVILIFLGLGFGFFSSPNTNAIMSSVDKKFYGVASATVGTMRLLGQMVSMGITMLIFSFYLGPVPISADNHHLFLKSIRVAFIIYTLLSFSGIFASLARRKIREINRIKP